MKKPGIVILFLFACYLNPHAQGYIKAHFIGNKEELKHLIESQMQYPPQALNNKIEGKVKLSFIVGPDGSKKNITVEQSVNPDTDKEAIRLLNLQIWKPSMKYNKYLKETVTTSIKFKIKKYIKVCKERGYKDIIYSYKPLDSTFDIYAQKQLEKIPKPVFGKKNKTLVQFINEKMKYPELAFNQNISGTVKLSFIVEKNGKVSHVKVEESVGGGCDQEAIRILKQINWMSGIIDDKAVRSRMQMDITFRLADQESTKYLHNNQNNTM